MKTLRLKLGIRAIPIYIGDGILDRLGAFVKRSKLGTTAFVITMPGLKRRFGAPLEKTLKNSGTSVRFLTVPDS